MSFSTYCINFIYKDYAWSFFSSFFKKSSYSFSTYTNILFQQTQIQ